MKDIIQQIMNQNILKSTGKGTDYLAPLPADSFYLFFFDFFVFF